MTEDQVSESATSIAGRLRAAGCVFAEDEAALLLDAAADPEDLERLVAARVEGRPLEPLLGWVAFDGRRLRLGPGVFVPRRRTEVLAREAARLARAGDLVLDLCCGIGAVGATVAARVPGAEVWATDIEPEAVRWAGENLDPARVVVGDLFEAVPTSFRGRFAVIAANAPYVPTDAIAMMPPEARDHEPWVSLDGGADGLDLHRRIVREAPGWLRASGHLMIEASADQAPVTAGLMQDAGFATRIVSSRKRDGRAVVGTVQPGASDEGVPDAREWSP
jgi:release factor glutamine methyltransferase